MKTQISRNSRQSDKRYSSVYQQQGRVVLDSDINELSDIVKARLDDSLNNVVLSGAPADHGLEIINDNGEIKINPGRLYIDGIGAELIAQSAISFAAQTDLLNLAPLPTAGPGNNYQLYADVWERSVTGLEDQQLIDPGLHGADSCTRSQTMLQVKWANPNSIDVMSEKLNPSIGTAPVSLSLIKSTTSGDTCDPCAIEVDIDERIGNYLFRVEVHDVWFEGAKQFITLKWSRDNGAEQFLIDSEPSDFKTGEFIYEFFDDESEKNLGNHFMTADGRVSRGVLVENYNDGASGNYVRQWDGSCTINLSDQTLIEGIDRGAELDANLNENYPGFYAIIDDKLSINLELMLLDIWLKDQQGECLFVAGDFWSADVREAVNVAKDYVLGSADIGQLPHGVKHHYLVLADVTQDGKLVAQSDALSRQFNFPALTNVMATDVGFEQQCANLFHDAKNVQQALDALCDINAQDIAYTIPQCVGEGEPTVRSLLGLNGGQVSPLDGTLDTLLCRLKAAALPYLVPSCGDEDEPTLRSLLNLVPGNQALDSTLDALLCDLRADHIPLNHAGELCEELVDADSVQQALNILCEVKVKSGCSIAVDADISRLDVVLKEFATTAVTPSVWLCLKAATHKVEKPLEISGKDSIKIIGSGTAATEVHFTEHFWTISAQEVILRDITFVFTNEIGNLKITAQNIVIENCHFKRHSSMSDIEPLLMCSALSQSSQLIFNANQLRAAYSRLIRPFELFDFIRPELSNNYPKVAGLLKEMLTNGEFQSDFDDNVKRLVEVIIAMKPQDKISWQTSRPEEKINEMKKNGPDMPDGPLTSASLTNMSKNERTNNIKNFYELLPKADQDKNKFALVVKNFIFSVVETGFGHGLGFETSHLGVQMSDNIVKGNVVINNRWLGDGYLLNSINVASPTADIVTGGNQFAANKNQFYRIVTYVDPSEIKIQSDSTKAGTIQSSVTGYRRAVLTDNEFSEMNGTVAAGLVQLNQNYFNADDRAGSQMRVVGSRVMIGNNVILSPDGNAKVYYYAGYGSIASIITDNYGSVEAE